MCNYNPLGWCFGNKQRKKKKKKGHHKISIEDPAELAMRYAPKNMIDTAQLEKYARARGLPSRMDSKVKTTDITTIYKLPTKQFNTIEEIVASQGFELDAEIGRGASATVFKARRLRNDQGCACKVMDMAQPKHSKTAKSELFVMEKINHPNCIKMYKHFVVEIYNIRRVYIFMQLAEGGSLASYMSAKKTGLPEDMCRRMFAQMVCAVNHMHSKGIAHRDLKLANVLLDSSANCLVGDYGLSRVVRKHDGEVIKMHNYAGTYLYMAPEILLARENSLEYDPFMVDMWALGVILYFIIYHEHPFSNSASTLEEQIGRLIKFSSTKQIFEPGPQIIDIISRCLEFDTLKRITMQELITHPWISAEVVQINKTIPKQERSLSISKKTLTISDQSSQSVPKEGAARIPEPVTSPQTTSPCATPNGITPKPLT